MKYRTADQFTEILEDAHYGNWNDAAHGAVNFGFYANDLIKAYDSEEHGYFNPINLAIIAETAAEIRGES